MVRLVPNQRAYPGMTPSIGLLLLPKNERDRLRRRTQEPHGLKKKRAPEFPCGGEGGFKKEERVSTPREFSRLRVLQEKLQGQRSKGAEPSLLIMHSDHWSGGERSQEKKETLPQQHLTTKTVEGNGLWRFIFCLG